VSRIRKFIQQLRAGEKKPKFLLASVAAVLALILGASWPSAETSPDIIRRKPTPSAESKLQIVTQKIYVHVIGEVQHPGVYMLPIGARFFEAVALAGGFRKKADQSSVNLARVLTDGEQLAVLAAGQLRPADSGSAGSSGVNLNRATAEQLESLPGVGPKLAGRIIDWRTANGGFAHVADLLEVGGIGDKLYAAIKPMVSL
jgi:competence protein ComEA